MRTGVAFSLERLIELLDCLSPVLLFERLLTFGVVLVPGIGERSSHRAGRRR